MGNNACYCKGSALMTCWWLSKLIRMINQIETSFILLLKESMQNNQAVKEGVALGEKSCEIKGVSQEWIQTF